MPREFTNTVESTEADQANASQWCLIYERRTGKVVHIHQFLPLTTDDLMSHEALEKAALAELAPDSHPNADSFGVFHPKANAVLEPNVEYVIDLKSHSLSGKRIDPYERMQSQRKKTINDEI